MHGLAVGEIVVEEGLSGSIPVEDRIVIAAKLDRLFRSALDALLGPAPLYEALGERAGQGPGA
jgi:hypothetical protein